MTPAVEYVLTAQSMHCFPNVVDLPAAHCVQLLAPEAEIFPAAQLLQELAPVLGHEYKRLMYDPISGPEEQPARHPAS